MAVEPFVLDPPVPLPTADDGHCEAREDGIHCVHWWDAEPCCACGHTGPEEEGKPL